MTATSSPCDSTVLSDMYVHPHGVAFSAATTVVLVFPCIWWPTKLKQGVSVKTSLQWVQILGATTPYHPWDWNICLHSYFYHKIQPFRKVKYIYIYTIPVDGIWPQVFWPDVKAKLSAVFVEASFFNSWPGMIPQMDKAKYGNISFIFREYEC